MMKLALTKLLYKKVRINSEGKYNGRFGTVVAILQDIHGTMVRVKLHDPDKFSVKDGFFVRPWFYEKHVDLVVS